MRSAGDGGPRSPCAGCLVSLCSLLKGWGRGQGAPWPSPDCHAAGAGSTFGTWLWGRVWQCYASSALKPWGAAALPLGCCSGSVLRPLQASGLLWGCPVQHGSYNIPGPNRQRPVVPSQWWPSKMSLDTAKCPKPGKPLGLRSPPHTLSPSQTQARDRGGGGGSPGHQCGT